MSPSNGTTEDNWDDCEESLLLDQPLVQTVLLCIYALVFATALIGNSFAIIVICAHRSMRTSTNFFLVNLALADLQVALFCILQNYFHIVGMNWQLGDVLCKLYVFVLHTAPSISIGVLVCVSLEKYVAVLHPLLALKLLTPRLRATMISGIWITSILVNLPYYFTTMEKKYRSTTGCFRDVEGFLGVKSMITGSFVVWYVVPLLVMGYLYSQIGFVLWKSSLKPLAVAVRYSNDSCGGTATLSINCAEGEALHENGHSNGALRSPPADEPAAQPNGNENVNSELIESRKKVIRLLIAIVTSFALLTLPNHVRLLFVHYIEGHACNAAWTALLQPVCYLLLFCSSTVNPFLYAFLSKRFRSATKEIMGCSFGRPRRKYTRTRTQCSEVEQGNQMASRSPSLTRATARACR